MKFCEPIYSVELKKNRNDLITLTNEFIAKNHLTIKKTEFNKIVIDSTIRFYPAGWGAWIKEIVFEFEEMSKNKNKLLVYGKYALFPHNIFFLWSFIKKRINKEHFTIDLRKHYENRFLDKTI